MRLFVRLCIFLNNKKLASAFPQIFSYVKFFFESCRVLSIYSSLKKCIPLSVLVFQGSTRKNKTTYSRLVVEYRKRYP